jgi:hypothetical protein
MMSLIILFQRRAKFFWCFWERLAVNVVLSFTYITCLVYQTKRRIFFCEVFKLHSATQPCSIIPKLRKKSARGTSMKHNDQILTTSLAELYLS